MREMNKCFIKRRVGILIPVCLLCIGLLFGCRKNTVNEPAADLTPTVTAVPTVTPTPTPAPTPTPVSKPWESYEKFGERDVYRVPVEEFTEDMRVEYGSHAGDYVLLVMWDAEPEDDAVSWQRLLLLRPALSGEAVTFCPDYFVRSCKVLADGTVFVEESPNGTVHVFDSSFKETGSAVPAEDAEVSLLTVTEDGHLWRYDATSKTVIYSDRNGGNEVVYDTSAYGNVWQDLGEGNGKKYFMAMASEDYAADMILCIDETTGEVSTVEEKILNVTTGEKPVFYGTVCGTLYDFSDETWYLHLLAGNGHKIAFPRHYQYETINCFDGDMICVSGYIWGESGEEHSWIKPGGCRIYDIGERTVLGEMTSLELEPYNSFFFAGMNGSGLVCLVAGNADGSGKSELLLWNLNAEKPEPLSGFCDLTETSPEEYLAAISEEYRDNYGILYTPSEMKTIEYDEETGVLSRVDFLNRLARGISASPDEFPKDADGIALRLENVRGHERGHSVFNPYIFSDMSRAYYGVDYEKAFYRLIDAVRAGEDTFEAEERIMYNWSVARFATWYYPVSTQCISTDYNFYDEKEWKNGRGLIRYTVPKEEAAAMVRDFEQHVCDILDDCIADDYTDFEKMLALYEYITVNWIYDYEMYEHINDYEYSSKGSIFRCMRDRIGICWEIAGLYEYLLMQCGINAEDAEGTETRNNELHAWTYLELDGKGYNVDPTWGLSYDDTPDMQYFLFTDKEREERDCFPFETCFVLGTDDMVRQEMGIFANDETYAPLWAGDYIGMDRTAKKVIFEDNEGVLHSFRYGE